MSRRHFLISSASRRKLIFENIQGVYKVFGGCSVKEKRQEKQQNGKSNTQTTQNPFSAPKLSECADVIQLCHKLVLTA